MTSLPDTLFSGSSTSVVEGSVLWLYCEVNSTSSSLSVSWLKDGVLLVQDSPHIRLRTTSTSSSSPTLLLVLDNVVSSDAGVYQCTAQDGVESASGSALTLSGLYYCLIILFICIWCLYRSVEITCQTFSWKLKCFSFAHALTKLRSRCYVVARCANLAGVHYFLPLGT